MHTALQAAPLSVTVEEAARMTGTTRSKIYEVMANGDLQTFKIGKRRLVLVNELKTWLERAAKVGAR